MAFLAPLLIRNGHNCAQGQNSKAEAVKCAWLRPCTCDIICICPSWVPSPQNTKTRYTQKSETESASKVGTVMIDLHQNLTAFRITWTHSSGGITRVFPDWSEKGGPPVRRTIPPGVSDSIKRRNEWNSKVSSLLPDCGHKVTSCLTLLSHAPASVPSLDKTCTSNRKQKSVLSLLGCLLLAMWSQQQENSHGYISHFS